MFKLLLSLLTLGALSFGCVATRTRGWSQAANPEASGPGRLRVLTLNTAHGVRQPALSFLANRSAVEGNLASMARALSREDADVVALQEVHAKRVGARALDQLDLLAAHSGYGHRYFGVHYERPALEARRGTALLSRSELGSPSSTAFNVAPGDDHGWVVATVRAEGLLGIEVDVVSVHLDPYSPSKRVAQMDALAAAFADRARPLVVMGDFNADWAGRDGVGRLAARLGLRAHQPNDGERTFPSAVPLIRVDWILVSPELRILRHRTFREPATDHLGVVADIGLSPRVWARVQGLETRVRMAEAARAREVPVLAGAAAPVIEATQAEASGARALPTTQTVAREEPASVRAQDVRARPSRGPAAERAVRPERARVLSARETPAARADSTERAAPQSAARPAPTLTSVTRGGVEDRPSPRPAQEGRGQVTPVRKDAQPKPPPTPVAKDAQERPVPEPVAAARSIGIRAGPPQEREAELDVAGFPRALSSVAARALGIGATAAGAP